MLNDGRLLLAGGCLPFTDARQGDLEDPGVLIAPAGLLAQADQPTGNGLVYPKVRQWSVPQQSCLLSSAVRVRKVGAFAQGVPSSAVLAYHDQHVLCCTAFGALEHPSPKDDAYHRPCPCSSSHQLQAVTAVVCQYPLFDTKAGKLECCIRLTCCVRVAWCHRSCEAAQALALWWRGNCLYGVLEVLLTPSGQSVRELYEGGALLGASARAWTSLACTGSGCCAALADLRIITCDPVVPARP